MLKDKLEALGTTQATRRTMLKGLLVGLGAGVLVQASGGVTAYARSEQEKPGGDEKTAKKMIEKGGTKKKGEEPKKDKAKSEKGEEPKKDKAKSEKGEKKKTEEPKAQHKK